MKTNTSAALVSTVQTQRRQPLQSKRYGDVSSDKQQALIKRGVQHAQRWSESRAARIEELREQVRSGTYKVDSLALAQHMLSDQTDFLEIE
jgi:anti-sigma28 factor (negative regulator of flagellin synthesis)